MDTLQLPSRLLMGPGPANIHPRVRDALGAPLLGHLDPVFIGILGEVQDLLRSVFDTRNPLTLAVSGTGSAGIEACLQGLIEPNDSVVVGVQGFFGGRMAEMAARAGAQVTRVEAPWGSPLDLEALRRNCKAAKPRLIGVVHAETSTGVHQPLEEVAAIARKHEALLVVDCVTSLGGLPLVQSGQGIDELGIDAAASCSQKCLGSPPGLAPVTVSPRAAARMAERRRSVAFYLDLPLIARYWNGDHAYHHTAPVSMICALREALRLVIEEGQAERWRRHAQNGAALVAGLEALGLEILAPAGHRLPMLTAVHVPPGMDDAATRRRLLDEFNLEIGGGLGELKGRVWRIGLMGETSRMNHVILLLAALGRILGRSPQSVGLAIEQAGLVAAAGTAASRAAGESR
jgi:alanine-glyoxylate transaminase/serine-glyoxylate transaminase/serine-pyruvate transaminase